MLNSIYNSCLKLFYNRRYESIFIIIFKFYMIKLFVLKYINVTKIKIKILVCEVYRFLLHWVLYITTVGDLFIYYQLLVIFTN